MLDHFKERPEALLVLRITEGDGWEKLCPFLGQKIPRMPFPHANKANDRSREESALRLFYRKVRRRLGLGW